MNRNDPAAAAETPLVSVVVPAHNAETTIERALGSVRRQDYPSVEVIVVDDSSVDQTAEKVKSFRGLPVILKTAGSQLGAAGARNLAIASARGTYIAFLDADDVWLAGKLTRQVDLLNRHPAMSFVTCEADLIGPGGKCMGRVNPGRPRATGAGAWKTLLAYACVATPCVVARRDAVEAVGGFNEKLRIAEDQDLWIRLALQGEVGHVPETLVHVHDVATSLSKTENADTRKYVLPMVLKHLKANRDRLSEREARAILGHRYTSVGRNCYQNGHIRDGLALVASAIAKGHQPVQNIGYLVTASPPLRFVKRLLGYQRSRSDGIRIAEFPPDMPPQFLVVIDTEEEFDWSQPFSRHHRSVQSIRCQHLAQGIFDGFGIKPTYVLDYPVVDDDEAVAVIREFYDSGRCEIGAHLHPWVNPPHEEETTIGNSYPWNLPFSLEYRKLAALSQRIRARFGVSPVMYKAGRYGMGPSTAKTLRSLGFAIDASVVPHTSFARDGGPDFRSLPDRPFWFGDDLDLLEVPLTRGFAGLFGRWGPVLYPLIANPHTETLRMPALFARLGLLERITLTPEGISYDELCRLTRALLKRGQKVFCFTYHSSSLLPGSTPYVTDEAQRRAFLATMEQYFETFVGHHGFQPTTLQALFANSANTSNNRHAFASTETRSAGRAHNA
jgi:glycosyltransferase involved in cell wall biosynthesis